MATTESSSLPPNSRQTTILVNNLHCPSCVSNVEETLSALAPAPFSISTSIVLQEVIVVHLNTLTASRIARALEDAGFELDSVLPSGSTDAEAGIEAHSQSITNRRPQTSHNALSQTQKHIEKCEECSAQLAALPSSSIEKDGLGKTSSTVESISTSDETLTSVMDDRLTGSRTRITLAISGMSCSSCVSKITGGLRSEPWILSADVNLLTNSAVVVLADSSHVEAVLETVRSSGYAVELVDSEEIRPPKPVKAQSSGLVDAWKASFVISGMSCSSCVGKVSDTLNQYDWTDKVDVNLVAGSATVEFRGKEHLDEITDIIDDLGYEATLSDVESRSSADKQSLERTVTIQVDGMHCQHCPQRIENALEQYAGRVQVVEPPSKTHGRLIVSYIPESPSLTIRDILRAIAEVDKAFAVSVYRPPSLEERSQAMHRRQQWQIARRLLLAVLAAFPAFIIGIVYMSLVPEEDAARKYLEEPMWIGQVTRTEWALFIIATPVYFFAADLFHRRMLTELKALWRPGSKTPILRRFYRFGSMDMLMSLGTTIAYFSSIAMLAVDAGLPKDGTKSSRHGTFFDAVVFLTMFLMIGRLLEAYSKAKAGDAVSLLGKLRPTEAILVQTDSSDDVSSAGSRTVPLDHLDFGDVVRVAHGASPPYDGTLVEGKSQFDESSLTGESKPVFKGPGDEVFSGTINQGSPVSVRVTRLSGNSMLDQIIGAVREGQIRRAPIERTADLITGYFVPVVTLVAVLDWIIWLVLGLSGRLPDAWLEGSPGGWEFWSLQFAISVFVVACPCGIGLAAPTALFVGGGLAARHGILVKGGGEAFQEASQLDCIIFDKTGTITEGGQPAITDHHIVDEDHIDQVWGAVMELEHNSTHPIATAVVSFIRPKQPASMTASNVDEIPGKGLKGSFTIGDKEESVLELIVGNEALMRDHDISIPSSDAETLTTWKKQAKSVVLVGTRVRPQGESTTPIHWRLSLTLAVADPVRPEAKQIIQALRGRSIAVWMISGDNPTTAHAVGEMVGIPSDNIIAGVLPDKKAEKVQYLQKALPKTTRSGWSSRGKDSTSGRALVGMVGDGINDSPALTVADVGIAIGSGSDIAISSAEFVLITSGLASLLTLIDLSRLVFRRIKFNFGWALVYNCIAVPVAAGVFFPIVSDGQHVRLDPIWASLAMALSSVSVVCSSLLMRTQLPLVGFRARKW